MTVIAWDGHTLAADKCSVDNGTKRTTTKIYRAPDGSLYGAAGDSAIGERLFVWYLNGCDPDNYPDKDSMCSFLVITKTGRMAIYDGGPYPDYYEDDFIAVGSGRAFAIGAMSMGADARRAVEIASEWDECCGKGVDTLQLNT